MIENLDRFIAYICPDCSGISDMTLNVFNFSGKKGVSLDCEDKLCNGKTGTLHMKDDKIKLSVKCPVCAEAHTYSVSTNAFWSKDLITFDCHNSGITIFYAGNRETVLDAIDESEKMYDLFEAEPELLTDELKLILETLDALHYVMEEKRMVCKCGSRNMFPVFESDKMFVECEDCKQRFPIVPSAELLRLLTESDDDLKL